MRFLLVLISAILLSSQTVKADKLLESGYFNIETHTDHFTVKVLVADLVGRDSWMKDGYIRAYVKEPEVHYNYVEPVDYIDIARVYTFDQDGNGLPTHRIKAQSLMEGATVIQLYQTGPYGERILHLQAEGLRLSASRTLYLLGPRDGRKGMVHNVLCATRHWIQLEL